MIQCFANRFESANSTETGRSGSPERRNSERVDQRTGKYSARRAWRLRASVNFGCPGGTIGLPQEQQNTGEFDLCYKNCIMNGREKEVSTEKCSLTLRLRSTETRSWPRLRNCFPITFLRHFTYDDVYAKLRITYGCKQ